MKKILVLGTGMVSGPGVKYLLEQPGLRVTVADQFREKAQKLIEGYSSGRARSIQADNHLQMSRLIQKHDIILSLLPWNFHPQVAELCLHYNKHLLTTSYVSEAMKKFAGPAERSGLLFLNEIGVDPGIDHMSAMRIIDRVHREGGKILGFRSYCGGLPAPDSNDNPIGYKFSWNPRGVLLASKNSARYLEDGRVEDVEGVHLFSRCRSEEVEGVGTLEFYPNRDSLPYQEMYRIPEALTVIRCTYRYPGWSSFMKAVSDLGLIDESPLPALKKPTYRALLAELTGAGTDGDPIPAASQKLTLPQEGEVMKKLTWLGLFQDDPLPESPTILDVLCRKMQEKMAYKEGEKDMVLLRHRFHTQTSSGRKETILSTLISFGIPHGDSAMARTVGLSIAIAARFLAEEQIRMSGVRIPISPEIYEPVLTELSKLGISMKEETIPGE